MWFIDVQTEDYTFYYNMEAYIHNEVEKKIGKSVADSLYRSPEAKNNINKRGHLKTHGSAHLGMIGSFNEKSQQSELISAMDMAGICAIVSKDIAEAVLERAKYYCPVDTGILKNSGYIEDLGNGKCIVKFDCQYAWFVHEFTWRKHKYPTTAKFLTIAIQEVQASLGGA